MAMLLRRAGLLGSVRPAGWRSPAAPRRLASSQQRRTARAEKKLAKARTYLAEQGYAAETVEGILRTLEKTPGVSASVSMLRSMGEVGLRSLVESVDAEAEALAAKRAGKARVHIRVAVPHEGLGGDLALRFDAFEGDNLMDIAAADPLLRGYIECACDGLMACSTCHVIVRPPPSPPAIASSNAVGCRRRSRRSTGRASARPSPRSTTCSTSRTASPIPRGSAARSR